MAIAGFVLGIVAIVISFIPCGGIFAFLPAILGIIFSYIGLLKAKTTGQGKEMAIAGLILSILAILFAILFILVTMGILTATNPTVGGGF